MDRRAWIDERRAAVQADYDAGAATYDENPYPAAVQEEWIRRLLATCPEGGIVLGAPCGTGRYFSVVVDAVVASWASTSRRACSNKRRRAIWRSGSSMWVCRSSPTSRSSTR